MRTLAHLGVSAHPRGVSELLHGTPLVAVDLELLESVLPHPLREPDYRQGRCHRDFLVTLAGLGIRASRRAVEEACELAAGELPPGG